MSADFEGIWRSEIKIRLLLSAVLFTLKEYGLEEIIVSIPNIGEWIDTRLAQEAVMKLMQEIVDMK